MPDAYEHHEGGRWRPRFKICPACGSTNLTFPDKYYARCRDCRKLISRSALRHHK